MYKICIYYFNIKGIFLKIKEFLNEFVEIYEIKIEVVLKILLNILSKELNLGEVFFKLNEKDDEYRVYERYFNKNGIAKERKVYITKKIIKRIANKLEIQIKEHINQIYKKNLQKYPYQVIKAQIIKKEKHRYILKIENEKVRGILDFNKANNHYQIGDFGYFHIYKVIFQKGIIRVFLDDNSINIEKYKISKILNGIFIKKLKIYKDFIVLSTAPKIDKTQKEILELNLNKKVYFKKEK